MVPIPQEWVAETISKYEVQVVYAADINNLARKSFC